MTTNAFRSMEIKELDSFLRHHCESDIDTEQVNKTKDTTEGIDRQIIEASRDSIYSANPSKQPSGGGEKGKKRAAGPIRNPRQVRNKSARARALRRLQAQLSVASLAGEQLYTLNPTTIFEDACRTGLLIENITILSSPALKDSTATEGQFISQKGRNSNSIQVEADDNSQTESKLKAPAKTVKPKAIDSETNTKTFRNLDIRPQDKHEPIISPVFSREVSADERKTQEYFVFPPSPIRPLEKKKRFRRDLGLIHVEDMDSRTRHDRIRNLNAVVARGDRLTETEELQLAELKARGTRARNRDLSQMDVASMDTRARSIRRQVLRRKIDRYEVLNEAEIQQLTELGMFYYTKGGKYHWCVSARLWDARGLETEMENSLR
ncbi:hypothetical protein PV08_06538 [Exophiala spinifera]|uniref:Uncharacterized protein n=1 Tax=Exophiala spinifera TaxID=91928 RepID=A0A0D2BYV6_9EURO|nr:uncharacterized protein PV08_06538 [Exophiala spinifera]KIW16484.1 hypothetical protein PV08_06538 [Exophiala spinifera]